MELSRSLRKLMPSFALRLHRILDTSASLLAWSTIIVTTLKCVLTHSLRSLLKLSRRSISPGPQNVKLPFRKLNPNSPKMPCCLSQILILFLCSSLMPAIISLDPLSCRIRLKNCPLMPSSNCLHLILQSYPAISSLLLILAANYLLPSAIIPPWRKNCSPLSRLYSNIDRCSLQTLSLPSRTIATLLLIISPSAPSVGAW